MTAQAMGDVAEIVLSAIAAICNVDRLSILLETSVQEIGLDSFSLLAMITYVETAYQTEFLTEETLKLFESETVNDVVSGVERIVGKTRTRRETEPCS